MKLIILKTNLKSGLDSVGRATGSGINLPILGSVLIKAEGNQIKLVATNLEIAITKNIFGKVVEEGTVSVPFNTLSSIVNNITSERINLESAKNGNLEIQTDNYNATIQCTDAKDFPIIPQIKKGAEFIEMDQGVLKSSLSKVVVAGEASDLRPEISGVLFRMDDNALKLVATDSFRLAEGVISDSSLRDSFKERLTITVPLKTIHDLIKVLSDTKPIRIYFESNQVLFETDDISIISRVIDGQFPNYEAIIPDSIDTEVLIDREELISALKLSSSFVSKSNDVKINPKDKKIVEVSSSDDSVGENSYLIPAKIEGPIAESIFNWKYLLDGVREGSTKDVFLGLNGSERPAIIKNPGDPHYIYILMPIKAN